VFVPHRAQSASNPHQDLLQQHTGTTSRPGAPSASPGITQDTTSSSVLIQGLPTRGP